MKYADDVPVDTHPTQETHTRPARRRPYAVTSQAERGAIVNQAEALAAVKAARAEIRAAKEGAE